ncbi:hypothetical protein IAS59_006580 [Cryptococcus gattii]
MGSNQTAGHRCPSAKSDLRLNDAIVTVLSLNLTLSVLYNGAQDLSPKRYTCLFIQRHLLLPSSQAC